MARKLRFPGPADSRRPHGAHRYDVWSPKLERRLKLFGRRALQAWLAIESDPQITAFCERPLVRQGERGNRVLDFWVQGRSGEALWILLRPSEVKAREREPALFAALEQWAGGQGMRIRYMDPQQELLGEYAESNWRTMLHYLAANRSLVANSLLERLQAACEAGESLQVLERRFASDDPVVVRTGVFSLLQRGLVSAATLSSEPLGPKTRFAAP